MDCIKKFFLVFDSLNFFNTTHTKDLKERQSKKFLYFFFLQDKEPFEIQSYRPEYSDTKYPPFKFFHSSLVVLLPLVWMNVDILYKYWSFDFFWKFQLKMKTQHIHS